MFASHEGNGHSWLTANCNHLVFELICVIAPLTARILRGGGKDSIHFSTIIKWKREYYRDKAKSMCVAETLTKNYYIFEKIQIFEYKLARQLTD